MSIPRITQILEKPIQTSIVGILANSQTVTQVGTANSPNTITITGVAGKSIYIHAFEVVTKGASSGNDINIKLNDGSTLKWQEVIGSGSNVGTRTGVVFGITAIQITSGSTCTLVIDAGGSNVVTVANILYSQR